MAENIENKGCAVYNAETNRTGDEAMDIKSRKNIEYLIILLISAAMLAAGWSNRKTIAGWGNQNTEDTVPVTDDAAEKEDLILEINSVEDYLTFVRSVNKGNTYKGQYVNLNADLDLAEVEEDLIIGNAKNTQYCFQGIFDGNGHHLSNVMITSDTDAGLFRNLEGTVANLQVESGDFSAPLAGAIASNTRLGSCILNCGSLATVNGQLAPEQEGKTLLAGESRGEIRNSFAPGQEETAKSLNQEVLGLDLTWGVDGWNLWEQKDDVPALTTEYADVVETATAEVPVSLSAVSIQGYYSAEDKSWCFAIPAGYEQTELAVTFSFTDGDVRQFTRKPGQKTYELEHEGYTYPITYLTAEHAATMMLDLDREDAVSYLGADKQNEVQGTCMILETNGKVNQTARLEKIKGHGNDSFRAPKKSYNLSFTEKQDLLGMGAAKDYVLLAAYRDNSLLSYKLTYDLVNEIGMAYAPSSEFVHLYINGEYEGVYLLTGKIQIGKTRFDLKDLKTETKELNSKSELREYAHTTWKNEGFYAQRTWYELDQTPEDVTGGYIIELDNEDYDRTKANFVSDRNLSFMIPSMNWASQSQVYYIADFWQDFENALYAKDGYNDKGKYYTDYIDLESFADQWLFYELNEENSVNSSVYYYKNSDTCGDGKLHASWPWDMEHSLAREGGAASSWFAAASDLKPEGYWMQFYHHRDFAEAVYKEWMTKFVPALEKALNPETGYDPDGISSLDWYLDYYGPDAQINETRWNGSDFAEKLEKIRRIYTVRLDFLTEALGLYDTDYIYFYKENGILYGVNAQEESIPVENP